MRTKLSQVCNTPRNHHGTKFQISNGNVECQKESTEYQLDRNFCKPREDSKSRFHHGV